MKNTAPLFALTCLVSLVSLTTATSCVMKQTSGTRASGQSRLMDETFAGQNACNPEEHTKPFIIEWDATDMSSFESLAANDVVMVKYEGCSLRVIDECRNDSIRGSQGAYKPPEWTSGSLETIDIHNEGELYAKLPLGKNTLSGRVSGGEAFHMEYFVAGTTYATRDAVYRDALADNPGCEGATHFVYAYNLGAFALGSVNEFKAEAGVSVYGYGGGGGKSSGYSAEKKGGDLGACQSDSATEVSGCKTPIRLNLRKIREGSDPQTEAMHAPETDESLNAAGEVGARLDAAEDAGAHYDAAQRALNSGDGKSCLEELDAHDALDPNNKSSDPKSGAYAMLRAQCVMASGQCDAGRVQLRKQQEAAGGPASSPEQIDKYVDAIVMMYCQGTSMSPRDQLLQAQYRLQQAAYQTRETVEYCETEYERAMKMVGKAKPKNEDDRVIIDIFYSLNSSTPACFARAGDCDKAYEAYGATLPKTTRESFDSMAPDLREQQLRRAFESSVKACRPK